MFTMIQLYGHSRGNGSLESEPFSSRYQSLSLSDGNKTGEAGNQKRSSSHVYFALAFQDFLVHLSEGHLTVGGMKTIAVAYVNFLC